MRTLTALPISSHGKGARHAKAATFQADQIVSGGVGGLLQIAAAKVIGTRSAPGALGVPPVGTVFQAIDLRAPERAPTACSTFVLSIFLEKGLAFVGKASIAVA